MALLFNNTSNNDIIAGLSGLTEEMYKLHNIWKTYELSSDLNVQKFNNFNFDKNINPDLCYYNGNNDCRYYPEIILK